MDRFWYGFAWGLVGTLAMTIFMATGMITGVAPMPKPIPPAIIGKMLGPDAQQLTVMLLGMIAHFTYGGFWGGVLAKVTSPVTVSKGLMLGVALWFIMQIIVLPYLGWGFFGMNESIMIAAATLVWSCPGLVDTTALSRVGVPHGKSNEEKNPIFPGVSPPDGRASQVGKVA